MKSFIYIVGLSMLFLVSSCLDKDFENIVNTDDIDYTKTSDMYKPVAGIYSKVQTVGFSDWPMYALMCVRGDDVNKGSTPTDQPELIFARSFEYNQISTYWALDGTWKNLYYVVLASNSALDDLDKYSKYLTTDEDKKLNRQYQAEVRFLKSYAFFFISRLWGDAPLLKDNSQVLENISKTSRAEIIKYISDEMDFCAANLPALRPNEMPRKGEVTKYSALALKAKANAEIGNWDEVLSASNEIITSGKFSLYPDYYQYYKIPGRNSNESFFELQYGVIDGKEYDSSNWYAFQGPRQAFKGDGGYKSAGDGWGFLTPSNKLEQLLKDRGETVRLETICLYAGKETKDGDFLNPGIGTEKEGFYDRVLNGKVYVPSSQLPLGKEAYGRGNNIRMLRYADILLLNAEAKVNKGQSGDEPFNIVRTRAKMPTKTGVTLNDIYDERFVELGCEWGERYFDLLRTNRAESLLPKFVKGQSEFYLIPKAQKDLNPNL